MGVLKKSVQGAGGKLTLHGPIIEIHFSDDGLWFLICGDIK